VTAWNKGKDRRREDKKLLELIGRKRGGQSDAAALQSAGKVHQKIERNVT
jgi:hypothetical protein